MVTAHLVRRSFCSFSFFVGDPVGRDTWLLPSGPAFGWACCFQQCARVGLICCLKLSKLRLACTVRVGSAFWQCHKKLCHSRIACSRCQGLALQALEDGQQLFVNARPPSRAYKISCLGSLHPLRQPVFKKLCLRSSPVPPHFLQGSFQRAKLNPPSSVEDPQKIRE